MAPLLCGCVLNNVPGSKYSRELNFAEIRLRPPLPRPSTLYRRRINTPNHLVLSLRAPQCAIVSSLGALRFNDELERGLDWTLQAADALRAKAVVIPTPVGFATSQRERDLLAAFVERLPLDAQRICVWEPSGIWDYEKSYPFAEKLGVVCAFDPLKAPPPPGPILYARLLALGTQSHFSESTLSETLLLLNQPDRKSVYITLDSDSKASFQQATRLKKLAKSGS
jgi:uncharacterized protein YecE (DUF72 family)